MVVSISQIQSSGMLGYDISTLLNPSFYCKMFAREICKRLWTRNCLLETVTRWVSFAQQVKASLDQHCKVYSQFGSISKGRWFRARFLSGSNNINLETTSDSESSLMMIFLRTNSNIGCSRNQNHVTVLECQKLFHNFSVRVGLEMNLQATTARGRTLIWSLFRPWRDFRRIGIHSDNYPIKFLLKEQKPHLTLEIVSHVAEYHENILHEQM